MVGYWRSNSWASVLQHPSRRALRMQFGPDAIRSGREISSSGRGVTAVPFPEQGVRPAGMGRSLAEQLPPARARFEEAVFVLVRGGRLRTLPAVLRTAEGDQASGSRVETRPRSRDVWYRGAGSGRAWVDARFAARESAATSRSTAPSHTPDGGLRRCDSEFCSARNGGLASGRRRESTWSARRSPPRHCASHSKGLSSKTPLLGKVM